MNITVFSIEVLLNINVPSRLPWQVSPVKCWAQPDLQWPFVAWQSAVTSLQWHFLSQSTPKRPVAHATVTAMHTMNNCNITLLTNIEVYSHLMLTFNVFSKIEWFTGNMSRKCKTYGKITAKVLCGYICLSSNVEIQVYPENSIYRWHIKTKQKHRDWINFNKNIIMLIYCNSKLLKSKKLMLSITITIRHTTKG